MKPIGTFIRSSTFAGRDLGVTLELKLSFDGKGTIESCRCRRMLAEALQD